jgi:hypothetical protein
LQHLLMQFRRIAALVDAVPEDAALVDAVL